MAANETVPKGVNYTNPFTTYSASGDPIAPDSLPAIVAYHKNGVAATIPTSPTPISQLQDTVPANITGYYLLTIATSSLAINDQIDVRVKATINGKDRFKTYSFSVVDGTGSLPYID